MNNKRRNERRTMVQQLYRERNEDGFCCYCCIFARRTRSPSVDRRSLFLPHAHTNTHAIPIRDYIIIIIIIILFSVIPHLPPFSSLAFFVSYVFRVPSSLPPVFSRTESVGCGPAPGASYQSYLSVRTI